MDQDNKIIRAFQTAQEIVLKSRNITTKQIHTQKYLEVLI